MNERLKGKIKFSISSDPAARINTNNIKVALVCSMLIMVRIYTDNMQIDDQHLEGQEYSTNSQFDFDHLDPRKLNKPADFK